MTAPVYFSRKPYTVTYYKDGEKKTLRRVPPPVLHNMLPTDVVKITQTRNDDFKAGDEVTIKAISQRQPNVLNVIDDKGREAFMAYYEVELEEPVHEAHGEASMASPERNQYLLWP